MNITMIGMVGFLMQSSKDLEQAFRTFCHYSTLVTPMVDFKYVSKEAVSIELIQNKIWPAKYPETARQAMDFALAAIVKFLRTLSGKNIVPIRVETEYSKRGVAEYQKLFQCEVVFNAKVSKVLLRKEDLKYPVVSNDKSLFDLFNSILAQKKAAIEENRCSENLKQVLFMQFKGRIPTIEEAALALNLKTRTLQRKLLEEKTTFRAIANKVREELALQLMKNPAVKVSEVSDVLGYSDLTAFRRAFES